MNGTIGRLASGRPNVAKVFEWGSRVVKLYKPTAAKPAAFREASIDAAVEATGLPILGDALQPVIIDWPDTRRSDPAADVCRSYLLTKLHAAEIATTYLDSTRIAEQPVCRGTPCWAAAVRGSCQACRRRSKRAQWPPGDCRHVLTQLSPHPITVFRRNALAVPRRPRRLN